MAVPLSKRALLQRVEEAILSSGWSFLFATGGVTHPFKLRIFREAESYSLLIYIWSLTHGGGAARPKNEYRIQMTGVDFPLQSAAGFRTLVLGWHEELGVFAGFDVQKHQRSTSRSPSIQIHFDTLKEAAQRRLSFQRKGNEEIAVAFAPDLFGGYVAQQENLHEFAQQPSEMQVLEEVVAAESLSEQLLQTLPAARQTVVRAVTIRQRESSFRSRVLDAYEHACAICDLQLDLLEAAHIIPVYSDESNDLTSNGLALCALHHKAYDLALLRVDENFRIFPNERKIESLRRKGHLGGLALFQQALREEIRLPAEAINRPRPEYLRRGLELRDFR
jgi:putative restriction endonuclease